MCYPCPRTDLLPISPTGQPVPPHRHEFLAPDVVCAYAGGAGTSRAIAKMNPVNSRAMAVATFGFAFSRATNFRNRDVRRSCGFHASHRWPSATRLAGRAIEPGDFFEGVRRGGDAYLLSHIIHDWNQRLPVVILRMRYVLAMDATGQALEDVALRFKRRGTFLLLSGIQAQPLAVLQRSGALARIGANRVFESFGDAWEEGERLLAARSDPS